MMKTQALLAVALLVAACDREPAQSATPAPAAAAVALRVDPQPAAPPVASIPLAQTLSKATDEPEPRAALDPAGVLDDEERRLLEADDATLTREDRVARAYAQRKLVMADSEHPLRPVLVAIDEDVASDEYAAMARDMWSGRAAFPEQGEPQAASSPL